MIMIYCDWLNQVQFMMKTREDNNVIDCTGAVYTKREIELLWSIRFGADNYENKIGQLHD